MPDIQDVEEMDFLQLGEDASDYNNDTDTNQDTEENSDNDDVTTDDDTDNQEDQEREVTETGNNQDTRQDEDDTQDTDNDDSDTDNTDDSGEDEPESIFKSIVDNSGVELEDEELDELLNTSEDVDGFNKVADTLAEKKAEARFDALVKQSPHAARLAQYERNGGDPDKYYDTYFPEVDYNQVEIEEEDAQTQKQVIKNNLELQGFEEEDINAELQDLEDAGLLHKRSQRSLKALQKHQETKTEEFEAEQRQLQEQRQKQAEEQYNNTLEVVEQGFDGVEIPDDKQDEFVNYLFKPVNEQGASQAQLDAQELSLEQRVLMAYLNFSGNDLEGFINNQAKNKKSRNLRENINKSDKKGGPKGKGKDKTKEKPGKPEDIVSPFV